jgi:hypothetical protein
MDGASRKVIQGAVTVTGHANDASKRPCGMMPDGGSIYHLIPVMRSLDPKGTICYEEMKASSKLGKS